jgi:hypothetical protein
MQEHLNISIEDMNKELLSTIKVTEKQMEEL